MAKVLDKSRDYGEIMGGGNARFEQDGALFDGEGKKLKAAAVVPAQGAMSVDTADDDDSGFADPPPPVAKAVADVSELDQQLAAQGVL